MSLIFDDLADLVDVIKARGIPATLDSRDLDAPGAIVDLERIGDDNTMCGSYTASAAVYLVAPDNGRPVALAQLLELYDKVSDLTTGAETVELALPDTAPLPALKLSPIQIGV